MCSSTYVPPFLNIIYIRTPPTSYILSSGVVERGSGVSCSLLKHRVVGGGEFLSSRYTAGWINL